MARQYVGCRPHNRFSTRLIRIDSSCEPQARGAFPKPHDRSANGCELTNCYKYGCPNLQAGSLINTHALGRQIADAMFRSLDAPKTLKRGAEENALARFALRGRVIVRFSSVWAFGHSA